MSSPINRGVFREAKREEIKKKKGENRKGKLERKKKKRKIVVSPFVHPSKTKTQTHIFLPFLFIIKILSYVYNSSK